MQSFNWLPSNPSSETAQPTGAWLGQRRTEKSVDRPTSDFQAGPAEGGLLAYARLLRRRKQTILALAAVGAVAGLLLSLPQAPVYRARASLEIQSLNENFLDMRDVNPTTLGGYQDRVDIRTQAKILRSRSLLARVVETLQAGDYEQLARPGGRLASWGHWLGIRGAAPESLRAAALDAVHQNLQVRASDDSRIVEILCDSTDPRLAARFVNTLMDEFIERDLEARWQGAQRTEDWLGRQLEALQVKLEGSEEELQRYAQDSGLLFTSDRQSVEEGRLRQFQEALSRAQEDRIAKQSRYEQANTGESESLPEILDDDPLRDYQVKLTDLRRQHAELSSVYTPAHHQVKRVQAQIDELEPIIGRERAKIVARIQNEYEAALRRERLLNADLARQEQLVSDQAGRAIQYNILKREVDTNRQIYENLLQRVKEAGMATAMSASNIRVVDPAAAPAAPYKPNHSLNTAMGSLLGLFAGLVLVVVREHADRTLKQPGEVTYYLNVPELGVIVDPRTYPNPPLAGKRKLVLRIVWRKRLSQKVALGLREPTRPRPEARAGGPTVELAAWRSKTSVIAECFRATRTSMIFQTERQRDPRLVVVTSPCPGEGKSTVASNLAISLAEISRRVLVIDADLYKPRLHEVFGVTNYWGLSDLLRAADSLEGRHWDQMVQQTEIPGLYLLPSGSPAAIVSGLFHSARAFELLRRLRADFDTVLIDTPPMIEVADARVLAQLADGVVLVLRAECTTRDDALAARERLAEDGTRVLGAVLNSWNPKFGRYTYYRREEARLAGFDTQRPPPAKGPPPEHRRTTAAVPPCL